MTAAARARTAGDPGTQELFSQGERDFQDRNATADAEELFRPQRAV